jgi:hypothetical protein
VTVAADWFVDFVVAVAAVDDDDDDDDDAAAAAGGWSVRLWDGSWHSDGIGNI